MPRRLAATCLLFALLCSPAFAHQERLAGADWVLAGQTGERAPYLRFDAGRVGGLGGCNRFGGRYQIDGDSLSFSPLISTRMACRPDLMKAEQSFFDMLARVKGMKLAGDRLDLLDGGGRVIGTFVKRVAD